MYISSIKALPYLSQGIPDLPQRIPVTPGLPRVVEGSSKMRFWGGGGKQKLMKMMEGLLKKPLPGTQIRELPELPETHHPRRLRTTIPHAPGVRMT